MSSGPELSGRSVLLLFSKLSFIYIIFQFSHGDRELRVGAGQDKAGLCQLWLQTGICRARPHCTAAHGTGELRAAVRVGEREPTPSAPRNSKPIKVVLCQDFTRAGRCDRAAACTYAHGLAELHQYRVLQVRRRNTPCSNIAVTSRRR